MASPLGYGSVANLGGKQTNYTLPSQGGRTRRLIDFKSLLPRVAEAIQCLGSENSTGSCLLNMGVNIFIGNKFQGLSPGATRQLNNVAWVSCKRMYLCTVRLITRGKKWNLSTYPSHTHALYKKQTYNFIVTASMKPMVNGPMVRLYNSSRCGLTGRQGVVQMRCNNTWSFINGSGWSYSDALVVCRELG